MTPEALRSGLIALAPARRLRAMLAAAPVALAAIAVLTGCSSQPDVTATPGATAAAATAATRQVHVAPVGPDGTATASFRVTSTATGATCEPGSEAIGQAYRCFAGNEVYDPCWAEKASSPTVLCVGEPWAATAARLTVGGTLAPLAGPAPGPAPPWGVELADGQRCILLQGAHSEFGGQVIDYYCNPHLSLLRGLTEAAPLWRARSVVLADGQSRSGPPEVITTAWFGTPGTFR
jgi:hypothetical protein